MLGYLIAGAVGAAAVLIAKKEMSGKSGQARLPSGFAKGEPHPSTPAPLKTSDTRTYWQIFATPPSDSELVLAGSILRSAKPTATKAEGEAIIWAARNAAILYGLKLSDFLSMGRSRQQQSFDTSSPARDGEIEIAKSVLATAQSEDPTGGSIAWIDTARAKLDHQSNPDKYQDLPALQASMRATGYVQSAVIGTLEMYRK